MGSLFKSTMNTRTILKDSLRFIRSDVPNCITEKEITWLIEQNVITIVDLREANERKRKKCSLIDNSSFKYLCMPVTGGSAVPETEDAVSKSYITMADSNMADIVETIMNSDTNVLYFCNAGKDRTGVVSAIILYRMGMSREYIVNDYMKSAENLKELLNEFAEKFPDIKKEIITPQARYIEEFLDWLESN